MPTCFYCDVGLTPGKADRGNVATTHTIDHIFPRRMIRFEVRSIEWHMLNQEHCCDACNVLKGDAHPLKWLSVMRDGPGVMRLSLRLRELGVPRRRVDKWLARRPSVGEHGNEPDGLPAAI